jgi:hypothetical protein
MREYCFRRLDYFCRVHSCCQHFPVALVVVRLHLSPELVTPEHCLLELVSSSESGVDGFGLDDGVVTPELAGAASSVFSNVIVVFSS